jgi:hypothetical protein
MTTETITIHNVQTGEIITRDMTAQELAQYEADKEANELLQAEAKAKAAAAASAEAKLEAIGLTPEEIAALRG